MTVFDQFFFSILSYYKPKYKKKANKIALYYISFLEVTLLLVFGIFFAAFFSQMNVDAINTESAWILFIIAAIFICFKNWMKYNGKKRMIMNAKSRKPKSNTNYIMMLWLLPVACLALSFILYKAV